MEIREKFPIDTKVAGQPDKNILVWAEQGIGDEIMFSSTIPQLEEFASSITVHCDPRLIDLFQNSFSDNIRFKGTEEPILEEDYDCQIPMGSLCRFQIPKEDFLSTSPCFFTATKEKSQLRQELKTLAESISSG